MKNELYSSQQRDEKILNKILKINESKLEPISYVRILPEGLINNGVNPLTGREVFSKPQGSFAYEAKSPLIRAIEENVHKGQHPTMNYGVIDGQMTYQITKDILDTENPLLSFILNEGIRARNERYKSLEKTFNSEKQIKRSNLN